MFDFNANVFSLPTIPASAKIVFVSDMFVEDYVGGAELTTEALIESAPVEVYKLRSKDVNMELLRSGVDKFWIFGNFSGLNPQLIPTIIGNMKYSIVEYDYKYCSYRSPEKHYHATMMPCDCSNQLHGKMISAFFYGARGLWWMSQAQKDRYLTMFPFLVEKDNIVLSSVFDKATLGTMADAHAKVTLRHRWIVLGSNSWIKGADDAEKWCKDNNKDYEVVWNLPYQQVLDKLATAEGFVYLPKGGDTCPRMVIEAKLLGCKLHLNDNVQHKDEEWFATDDLQSIQDYLFAAPQIFWSGIKKMMDYKPSISGYTTTYNCVKQEYPFEQCIKSMLQFCDEVCVVDGGSNDGTLERLLRLSIAHSDRLRDCTEEQFQAQFDNFIRAKMTHVPSGGFGPWDSPLKVKIIERDWRSKRHPVFDGMQKAEARAMCRGDFCWQMDSDEVVHEEDGKKILDLCQALPKDIDILSLPVIEYWGGPDKVRMDVTPWKWRLSRNKPSITHGIPAELRTTDSDGNLCAREGTDGCDMIDVATGQRLPHVTFYTQEAENVRLAGLSGNQQALAAYEKWFNDVVANMPSVFHYSWYDIARKIRLYRDYWTRHWVNLTSKNYVDTADTNMMFDVPWAEVTEEMIDARAKELSEKTGGHVWHTKWSGQKTPHIKCSRTQPKVTLDRNKK